MGKICREHAEELRQVHAVAACLSWFGKGLMMAVLMLCSLWSISAYATCATQSGTVTSGDSYVFNLYSCSPFGLQSYQAPAHGSLSTSNAVVTYTNYGDGATSDSFIMLDEDGAQLLFNITITASTSALTISPSSLTNPVLGTSYTQSLSTAGGNGNYSYVLATGSLPAGLTLSTSGVIAGTPTATGSFSFSVKSTDTTTPTALTTTKAYSMVISAPTLSFSPAASSTFTGMTTYAFSQQLSVSGGTAPYTFSLDTGPWPAGLSMDSSGNISGTPTAAGNYTVVVRVDDHTTGSGPYAILGTFYFAITSPPPPPVATASTTTVAYNSSANAVPLTLSGGTATSVTVVNAGSHGVATASGTSISYTPTTNYTGTDTFTYYASNAGGSSSTVTVTVTISPPASVTLSPASGTALTATVGSAYSQSFTAAGGSGSYTYQLVSGTLPNGLNFSSSSGALVGTPTATGSATLVITATDTSSGTNAPFVSPQQTYVLTVNQPTITVSPTTLSSMERGVTISNVQFSASSTLSTSYTFAATGTPAGLSLSSSGLLSGAPTSAGAYSMQVTATDTNGYTGSRTYSGSIGAGAPITSNSSSIVSYNTGSVSSTITIMTTGGTPTGLTINGQPSHGAIAVGTIGSTSTFTYTPTAGYNGSDSFIYTASNAAGSSAQATVTVAVPAPTFTMSPASTTLNATAGTSFSQTFTFTGGVSPYTYALVGTLPNGLSFDTSGSSPKITGTPTQSGDFPITVKMSSDGTSGTTPTYPSTAYTLHVSAPTLGITPTSLTQPQVGESYTQSLQTTGGTAAYTYSVSSGSLPAGLSLSGAVISGTPTTAGAYSFNLTSTDAYGFTAVQSYSGTVGAGRPVTANSSATVAYGSSANAITPTITGGTPTSLTISTSASHGTASVSGTTLLYTPATGYTGSDSFSYTATNAVGTSSAATVSITVSVPTIVITPSATWSATQGSSYTQVLTWSGGNAPYAMGTVTGLPSGLSVTATTSTSLTISGTPTQYGSFTVGVSATDSTTPTAVTSTQSYTLTVGQAAPLAVADSASTNANAAVTIAVTGNDTGSVTSIAIGTTPSHGTAVVSGLTVVYTPTTNYYGSDSFTYTATGPGGTSAAATVSVTVVPLAAPTSAAQSASVAPGQSVTLHVGAAASNGPITLVTLASAPSSGAAVVSGTDIIYTAASSGSGAVQFTYTLSNAFGTSAAITATISVGIVPVASNLSASGAAGATVVVNLMTGATGAPFTGATLGTVSPSTAGTAVISNAGSSGSPSYRLTFTPASTFAGVVTVTYSLSNASGASAAATVTITVAARTNAASDPQVKALVATQGQSASRFVQAQVLNFSRRLEALHGSGWARSSFGLGLVPQNTPDATAVSGWNEADVDRVVGTSLQAGLRKVSWPTTTNAANSDLKLAANNATASTLPDLPSHADSNKQAWSLWIAGTLDFGHSNASSQQDGFRFSTDGVSMGADYRISDKYSIGIGTGYSRDHTDIGDNGSKSIGQSVVATVYGSIRPTPNIFIDGMFGYSLLNFDSTRYVTDDGSFATGQRGGNQLFAGISGGYEFRSDSFIWSPYGKLNIASTTLAQYTETASGNNALTYFQQRTRLSSATAGLRAEGKYQGSLGTWMPRARVEYQHQFSGASSAGIAYADQSAAGPAYVISSSGSFAGNWSAGGGVKLILSSGIELIVDYSSNLNIGQGRYQSVLLGVNVPMR